MLLDRAKGGDRENVDLDACLRESLLERTFFEEDYL
jgi:hypothetical protein